MKVTLTIIDPDDVDALEDAEAAPIPLMDNENVYGVRFDYDHIDDVSVAVAQAVSRAQAIGGTIIKVDAHNGAYTGPLVLGVSEIAAARDVTRQYASQLGQRRNFPEPIAVLAGTPVWDPLDYALWDQGQKKRKVGRATS